MTEISFITQNGQQLYLKDATGRTLLAEKQKKLKAGKGISIAEDGTISVIPSGNSAVGFVITASGELDNLTFDKSPVELAEAIENGNIVIVNINNARFILTDVKDGTYLFSYLVTSEEENCIAQMATIIATGAGTTWTEIKTNFVAIKAAEKTESSEKPEGSFDCDNGNDFSDWEDFDKDSIVIYGNKLDNDKAGIKCYKESQVWHEQSESWSSSYYDNMDSNIDITADDIVDGESDKVIIGGKKYLIADEKAREEFETLQDTLILSDDFTIAEDGTLSLAEGVDNE